MSSWRNIASLPSRMITGDFEASLCAQSAHRGVEVGGHHDPVHDPDPLGLVRVDPLAEQQQLVRLLARHVAVDQRHDHERERAHVDLGRAEGRLLLGDDQVAGERDAERAGEHVAVGGADRGLAELADQPEQLRERAPCRSSGGPAARRPRSPPRLAPEENVVSCDEVSTTHAHLVVVAGRLEGRDQVRQQLVRERVARVGLVQRDRRDVVARRS